jgi:predicted small lipoprotein YifL
MLRKMKKLAALSVLALSLLSLAGCPEKKPDVESPPIGKAAASSAPTSLSPTPANAPAKPGGW